MNQKNYRQNLRGNSNSPSNRDLHGAEPTPHWGGGLDYPRGYGLGPGYGPMGDDEMRFHPGTGADVWREQRDGRSGRGKQEWYGAQFDRDDRGPFGPLSGRGVQYRQASHGDHDSAFSGRDLTYGCLDEGQREYNERGMRPGYLDSGFSGSSEPRRSAMPGQNYRGQNAFGDQDYPNASTYDNRENRSTRQGYDQHFSGQAPFGAGATGYGRGESDVGSSRKFNKGPKGYTRSDERIREDVCDRLTRLGHIDASDVEVQVANGEVTLTGTVPNRSTKWNIEHLCDDVSGVKDIANQIRVRRDDANETSERKNDVTNRVVASNASSSSSKTTTNDNGDHDKRSNLARS